MRRIGQLTVVLASVVVMTLSGIGSVAAQTTDTTTAQGGDTLIVSPPVDELNADPGQTLTRTITITNATSRSRVFSTSTKNAVPRGNEGQPDLVPDEGPYALSSWLTVTPNNVAIEAGESQGFEVSIAVPTDAGPGSHTGAIVFTPGVDPTGGAAVSVVAEVSALLLVNVSGELKNDVSLVSFGAEKTLYQKGPVTFTAIFKNDGNIVARPEGRVVVKNLFGKTVATLPIETQRVLPTAERRFDVVFGGPTDPNDAEASPKRLIGPYTATFSWNADSASAAPSKDRIWGVPLSIILPVVIGALALFLLLWLPRKRLKKAFKALRSSDEPDATNATNATNAKKSL